MGAAEYLQAYLPETGDARGWIGVLLMAAAFGLLMTSQIDKSMWWVGMGPKVLQSVVLLSLVAAVSCLAWSRAAVGEGRSPI